MWPFKRNTRTVQERLIITSCERPTATATSRLHLRVLNDGTQVPGGGIPLPFITLCGSSLDRGWDRRAWDRNELLRADKVERAMETGEIEAWAPGRVCRTCLTAALALDI